MPVLRLAFQVELIKVVSISSKLRLPYTAYCSILLTRSLLNKNDKGKSAAVSAGDNSSKASPVLLRKSSLEPIYPSGLGGISTLISWGTCRNEGSRQPIIA